MGRRTPAFRRVKKGDPMRRSQVNSLYDALESLERARPGPGMVGSYMGSHGAAYTARQQSKWDAVIQVAGTGAQAGSYTWSQVVGNGTGWTVAGVNGFVGEDAAFEANGNPAVPVGSYVRMWRDEATGQARFQLAGC